MPAMIADRLLSFASQVDWNTIEQAKEIASMPFVHPHVALMPDAHLGKGSSVGAVIPTLDVVIPAAVGVDIGCVDADTEYLSPNWGWRRIADYQLGQRVLQYQPDTGIANFAEPLRYLVRPQDRFYHLKTKYGIDQMLTADHRMLVFEINGRKRKRVQKVISAQEFVDRHADLVQGYKAEIETSFRLPTDYGDNWNADQVRVQVMTAADAHIDGANKAILHLVKPRKIERAQKLLADAGITCTVREGADGTTIIRYTPPLARKDLQMYWGADSRTLYAITQEVLHWDGSMTDRVYYTRRSDDADLVQYAFTASGFRATKRADVHKRDGLTDYRVFQIDKTQISAAGSPKSPIEVVPSLDGNAYCFTVPSGFLVLRRNGNIFITGNCGMIAARTRFTMDEIEGKDLAALRESIESAIPLSSGNYNRNTNRYRFTRDRITELENLAAKDDVDLRHSPKWREQLGSLGGGNHFIELCFDDDDKVWMFLHSGSRGVGNKIANIHIKVAKKLCDQWHIKLPNRDLAYLPQGTPEFTRYMKDLHWAQIFALLNRQEMMDRFRRALAHWMGVEDHCIETDRINCHHNYTKRESHMGKDVWLTRKGAISASEGEMGLIPGSMGTHSYVVQGRGNAAGLRSAPHGAGRKYSRTKAKELFTAEDLAEQMKGIEYRHGEQWIDEIPLCYKDIDVVMDDAKDLVEVITTLKQVLNCKGT